MPPEPAKKLQAPRPVRPCSRLAIAVLATASLLLFAASSQAQTFAVLHTFTGGADGATPWADLTLDRSGNLYGTTVYGGNPACRASDGTGCGTVFKLTHAGSGWILAPLYDFAGAPDGASPLGPVTVAADGTLYGTTDSGGTGSCSDDARPGCGTVFHLRPAASFCRAALCYWNETVLYRFTGGNDGGNPWGGVVTDTAGNLYGTTVAYGADDSGVAFQLTPSGSEWTESVIHTFLDGADGGYPADSLLPDTAGNLYGTTESGGAQGGLCGTYGCGTVFQLSPSGSGWTQTVLYSFDGNYGALPFAALISDAAGNLYGTAPGGTYSTVFQLTPSGGNWIPTVVYDAYFGGIFGFTGALGMDAAGNLYGTSEQGGGGLCTYGCGFVFKLTNNHGSWTYTLLHQFQSGDGAFPYGGVIVDANGNIYGTTLQGGNGYGVVFEITP